MAMPGEEARQMCYRIKLFFQIAEERDGKLESACRYVEERTRSSDSSENQLG